MVKNAMKLKKCEKNTENPESHNEKINSTEIEAVCVRGWSGCGAKPRSGSQALAGATEDPTF